MNRKWIKVLVDEDRKVIAEENYDKFYNLVNELDIPKITPQLFARPTKLEPIHSYGIILVNDSQTAYNYFITQKRTTIEFEEFIKCGPRKEFLYEYLSLMTDFERDLILKHTHDELWNALLLDEANKFDDIKKQSELIFETYTQILPDLIDYTSTININPPWLFPKGRKRLNDRTLLSIAVRELYEEAKIQLGDEITLLDIEPIFETYKGTDGVAYCTTYYVIKADILYEPPQTYLDTNIIGEYCLSNDMKNYAWISIPKNTLDISAYMKEYNIGKRMTDNLAKVHALLCSK